MMGFIVSHLAKFVTMLETFNTLFHWNQTILKFIEPGTQFVVLKCSLPIWPLFLCLEPTPPQTCCVILIIGLVLFSFPVGSLAIASVIIRTKTFVWSDFLFYFFHSFHRQVIPFSWYVAGSLHGLHLKLKNLFTNVKFNPWAMLNFYQGQQNATSAFAGYCSRSQSWNQEPINNFSSFHFSGETSQVIWT